VKVGSKKEQTGRKKNFLLHVQLKYLINEKIRKRGCDFQIPFPLNLLASDAV
jgi:hypothetical protein